MTNVCREGSIIESRMSFIVICIVSYSIGTLEFRSIIEPIRNTGFRDEHHFHLSYATALDTDTNTVTCTSALDDSVVYPVEYDTLVIGVGAVPSTFGVEGVKEHALFLKVSQSCCYQ